jgi:hypothetical protein
MRKLRAQGRVLAPLLARLRDCCGVAPFSRGEDVERPVAIGDVIEDVALALPLVNADMPKTTERKA